MKTDLNTHIFDIVQNHMDININFALDGIAEQIEDSEHLEGAILSDKLIQTYLLEMKKVITNKLEIILKEKGKPYLVKIDGMQDKIYCMEEKEIDFIVQTFADLEDVEKTFIGGNYDVNKKSEIMKVLLEEYKNINHLDDDSYLQMTYEIRKRFDLSFNKCNEYVELHSNIMKDDAKI